LTSEKSVTGQMLKVNCRLSLSLLMFWIFLANNINTARAFDDLAIITNFFYRGPNFHLFLLRKNRR